ncbi:MAG: hypothetical protein ONB13_06830 [candidate division KSB1 bacterium]|nr:hypothetical protein [candidate division KSB1 bacterium]
MFRFLLIFLFVAVQLGHGQGRYSAIVSWDPNKEPDLAGYRIYWGMHSRTYSNVLITTMNYDTIRGLYGGTRYYFAVTAFDTAGNESEYSDEVSIFFEGDEGGDWGDGGDGGDVQVISYRVYNYPNPFHVKQHFTKFHYWLPRAMSVSIEIYDRNQKLVRRIALRNMKSAGEHAEDIWDGRDDAGYYVSSGIYFGVLRFDSVSSIVKIVVLQ